MNFVTHAQRLQPAALKAAHAGECRYSVASAAAMRKT